MLHLARPTALALATTWKELDGTVRPLLAKVMRRTGKEVTAERMTEFLGRPITVSMLSDFASESKAGARFPVIYVDAFCRATGDDTLKRLILGPRLCELLELGERAAAILDERARRRVLKIPSCAPSAGDKTNGKEAGVGACAR